jgi:hypothetical protein
MNRTLATQYAYWAINAIMEPLSGEIPLTSTMQLNIGILADIDDAASDERDDEDALALVLATQEWFNIRLFVADAPDSDIAQWDAMVDAYGLDMQPLLTHSPFPSRYKTPAALKALGIQGSVVDNPSRGYWISGDGAGYTAPHDAAQALITAAQAYGSPTGGDHQKFWVFVMGGFTTLAQAAYEAVELGQLPDFFARIHVVGQPNYNSWWAPNAWNYLVANSWPADATPDIFGDWWLNAGYFKWHGFNRDNGTTDTDFWNDKVVTAGAMGDFLDAERAGSAFPNTYFRAGDAGAWVFLMSARLLEDFSPENTDNWVGVSQTYVNELWAAQTFGYGAVSGIGTGTPNPTHTWHNPHAWAPPLTVDDNTAAAVASLNTISKWYEVAGEALERYTATGATTTSNLYMEGGRSTVFGLTATDTTVNEDTNVQFSLSWVGPTIGSAVTVSFTETDEENMSTTLATDLAAVSQTGVTAVGSTLVIDNTATSPVLFNRTPDDTLDGARSYLLEIASVSSGGFAPLTPAVDILDVGAGVEGFLVAEFRMDTGSGDTLVDSSANLNDGFLGRDAGTTGDPDWVATGLEQIGTTDIMLVPHHASYDMSSFVVVVALRNDGVTGAQQFATDWDNVGTTPIPKWAFRLNGTEVQFLGRGAAPVTIASSGLGQGTGTSHLWVAKVDGLDVVIRRDGVQVASGTLTNVVPATVSTNHLSIGARRSGGIPVEGTDGIFHYMAFYSQVDDTLVDDIEQRAVDAIFVDHGVTITLG